MCGVTRAGMLILHSGVMICRPCADRVATLLRTATKSFLDRVWDLNRVWDAVDAGKRDTTTLDTREVFAKLREGVATTISPDDFKTHWDLGTAYAEMGLLADALSELATALDERAPHDMAQE